MQCTVIPNTKCTMAAEFRKTLQKIVKSCVAK